MTGKPQGDGLPDMRPVGHAARCTCPHCVAERAREEEPLPPTAAPGLPLFVTCEDGVVFNMQSCAAIEIYTCTVIEGTERRYIPQFWIGGGGQRCRPWGWGFGTEREARQAVNDLLAAVGLPPVYDLPADDAADTDNADDTEEGDEDVADTPAETTA